MTMLTSRTGLVALSALAIMAGCGTPEAHEQQEQSDQGAEKGKEPAVNQQDSSLSHFFSLLLSPGFDKVGFARTELRKLEKASVNSLQFMTSEQLAEARAQFADHFRLPAGTAIGTPDVQIDWNSLDTAVNAFRRAHGPDVGVVLHYGMRSAALELGVSIVELTGHWEHGREFYYTFDDRGAPFYTVRPADRSLVPAAGADPLTAWKAAEMNAYFTTITVKRMDHAAGAPPPFATRQRVVKGYDTQSVSFSWTELSELHKQNVDSQNNHPTRLVFSSMGIHGEDDDGHNTGLRHSLAVHGWSPTDGDLLSPNVGATPLEKAACDLGNMCPPKCYETARFP
jgi:hypothetical protein